MDNAGIRLFPLRQRLVMGRHHLEHRLEGLALWKSARKDSKIWFIVFLVVNTLGILEILYLYVFSKKKILAPVEEKK